MQVSLPVLDELTVPIQCFVPWDSLNGDDVARHCSSCNQTVHNVSAMSTVEAAAFVAANEHNVCLRFYKRPDGTIITRDCQEEIPLRQKGVIRRAGLLILSWLGLSLIAGCGLCVQGKPATPKRGGQQANPVEVKQGDGQPGEGNAKDGKQ